VPEDPPSAQLRSIISLYTQGQLQQALSECIRILERFPDSVVLYNISGACNAGLMQYDAAIENYRHATKIKPDYAKALAQKLHQQAHICDWDAIKEDRALIPELGILAQVVSPFSMLSFEDSPERRQMRSKSYANRSHFQPLLPIAYQPSKKPQPIRVGYFSADFHNHATMHLMIKVFECHNQKKFETHAYSFGPNRDDKMKQYRCGFKRLYKRQ
jgi:protein O-GlcNAc transferase